MEKENIVKNKSYKFALRIIKLYKFLIDSKKEYVLSKQILRCGTSIGANVEEGIGSSSKKDFINKIFLNQLQIDSKPMFLTSLIDLYKSYTNGKFALSLRALFGGGLNTYEPSEEKKKTVPLRQ